MTGAETAASSAGLAGAIDRGEVSEGGEAPRRRNYIGDGLRDALDPRKVLAR
jgi:hypothetical protein